jgi:predicted ester cyclase
MESGSRELVRGLFDEVFNAKKYDALGSIVAERYHEHALAPFGTEEPGVVDGPAHMRVAVEWLAAQFPDFHMQVESLVAEGDLVAARVRSEGTNDGPLNGVIPATGKRFSAEQTHWYRVADGQLAEHWATRDDLTAMMQLGVVRRPGPSSAA